MSLFRGEEPSGVNPQQSFRVGFRGQQGGFTRFFEDKSGKACRLAEANLAVARAEHLLAEGSQVTWCQAGCKRTQLMGDGKRRSWL